MWRITLKGTWSHKRRLIGTCAAVVLGVAFLAGTLVLGDTMRAGFDELFTQVNSGIDASVRGRGTIELEGATQRAMLDGSVVDDIRDVDGVAAAEPYLEGAGQIIDADGNPVGGNGPPTIAASWVENPDVNPYDLVDGRAPAASGEVAIDTNTADTAGLAIGDTTILRTPAPVDVTIVGLIELQGGGSAGGVTYTVFTLADAQRYLVGGQEQVSQVLVEAAPGVSQDELVQRLQPALPDGAEAITGQAVTEEATEAIGDDFLNFFEAFLLVFAGVALLVASFSIYNTFSITVAQRIRESALLRAVGSSRRQTLSSVVLEAAIVGVVASALGLVTGLGLAMGLKALLSAFGIDLPTAGVVLALNTVIVSTVVGLGVTLVASAVPAIRASRVAPLAALRDVSVDRSDSSIARAVVGAVLTLGGMGLVLSASFGDGGVLTRAGYGAALTLVGLVVLGPVVARPASALLGAPLRRFRGVTGSLARQNAMRNPRRTAATASALMVGVGVVTIFTVLAASVKATIDDNVSRTFGGDLVVSTDSFSGSGLSPQMAEDIAGLPEVERAVGLGLGAALIEGNEQAFTVADPADVADVLELDVIDGSMQDVGETGVAVSTDEAEDFGWSVGSTFTIQFVDGASQTLTVDAIYDADAGASLGSYVIPEAVWAPHAVPDIDTTVMIRLADGVDLDAGRRAVEQVTAAYGEPDVQDRDEYIDSVAGGIDQVLGLIYVLLALAIVIALMGIANTLSLSVHERRRELGLLRAVGQTRSQTRSMVRWESVLVSLFGTAGGLGLGTFLGWAMMRAVAAQEGLGEFAAPAGQLAIVLALGAIVGIVAAVRPARRAARLDVLGAIATE